MSLSKNQGVALADEFGINKCLPWLPSHAVIFHFPNNAQNKVECLFIPLKPNNVYSFLSQDSVPDLLLCFIVFSNPSLPSMLSSKIIVCLVAITSLGVSTRLPASCAAGEGNARPWPR